MTTAPQPALYQLDDAQHATVMAALRLYQSLLPRIPGEIKDIATNGGSVKALGKKAIDRLCKSINRDGLTLPEIAKLYANGPKAYAVVQQGGSSTELYLHGLDTPAEAEAYRINCALDGAYDTGPVVEVPALLSELWPLFHETAQAIVQSTTELECVEGGCYTVQLDTGPDEPVWRFTNTEDYEAAVALAAEHGIAITEGATLMPEGEEANSLDDFRDYINLELEAAK